MRKPNLFPSEAEAFIETATQEILGHGYPMNAPVGVYATGLLLSQWVEQKGLRCDFTPPKHLVRGVYQPNFKAFHLFSEDLLYVLNIQERGEYRLTAFSAELVRRRKSWLFRFYRRIQRMAIFFGQWISH